MCYDVLLIVNTKPGHILSNYLLSSHQAESPWDNSWGWTGRMCVTHRKSAALFPKFLNTPMPTVSGTVSRTLDMTVAPYWHELMVMKLPEVGLDNPLELCSCLTQSQCTTNITRVGNGSEGSPHRQWAVLQKLLAKFGALFPKNLNNTEYMKSLAALKSLTVELLS